MPVEINVTEELMGEGERIVIETGSLNSLAVHATQPATVSNVSSANVISNINRSTQNAVSNQFAVNRLSLSIMGKAQSLIGSLQPMEAKSAQGALTGNVLAESIASLKAATEGLNSPDHTHHDGNRRYVVEVMPNPIPSGLVYANMPLFLSYDNPDGVKNLITWDLEPLLAKK
jgi:hypothetical protein